ncbi:hypothetical protein EAG_11429, partial [Camponotus floridanus]
LRFAIIAQPMFNVLNVIPLPLNYENKFMYTEITNKLIATNKEMHIYLILTKQDLDECIINNNIYLCEKNQSIYHVSENTPSEIKIYTQRQKYHENCNVDHMIATRTIWLTL